jgi:hypothetical protein
VAPTVGRAVARCRTTQGSIRTPPSLVQSPWPPGADCARERCGPGGSRTSAASPLSRAGPPLTGLQQDRARWSVGNFRCGVNAAVAGLPRRDRAGRGGRAVEPRGGGDTAGRRARAPRPRAPASEPRLAHGHRARGVYRVAAELSRIGFIASPTSRSARGADILATDQACVRAITVQVKSVTKNSPFWLVGRNPIVADSHYYVLVNLEPRGGAAPEFYVVPGRTLAELNSAARPDRTGRELGAVFRRDVQAFRDTWNLLGSPHPEAGRTRAQPPRLAWISTDSSRPNPGRAGRPGYPTSRSFLPPHHGMGTGASRRPEAARMGRWARRWNLTATSSALTATSAGMSRRSRKTWRAWASW